jgi:hypothetical protein
LKKRKIKFEVVVQKVEHLMCTLPGHTSHAVRNIGKNFAVAINYEMEGTLEEPLGYKCCIKGRIKCGS